jgi:acetyl esterase/lipase
VDWFGPVDPATNGSRTPLEESLLPFHFEQGLVGADEPAEFRARARPLSLLPRVTGDAPPFLLAHGDRDRIVPPSESAALNDALGRAGADSRLELLAGAGHEDPVFDSPAMLAMTAAWLRTVMRRSKHA